MNGYTRNERLRIVGIGAVLPILIAAAGIVAMLSWSADLPESIAIHWDGSGAPDGFGSLAGLVVLLGSLVTLFAGIVTAATLVQRAGSSTRFLLGTSVWLAVFLTAGIGGSVWIQRGLADPADADSVLPWLLGAAVVSLVIAIPAGLLVPRTPLLAAEPDEVPAIHLADDERVVWTRAVGPRPWAFAALFGSTFVLLAGATVLLAATGATYGPALALTVLSVPVTVGASYWRARVSAAGVTVRSVIGVPRFSIPIDEVESARAVEVSPLGDFGGWGIRFGGNGRLGVVVRTGEALEIERQNGRTLVVTVADAATAAALINGLRGRALAAR